jgi:hypothetical protein
MRMQRDFVAVEIIVSILMLLIYVNSVDGDLCTLCIGGDKSVVVDSWFFDSLFFEHMYRCAKRRIVVKKEDYFSEAV